MTLLVAAVTVAAIACASANTSGNTAATTKPDSNLITTAEIDATPNMRDAYDLIQRLRPTWFTKARGGGMSISGSTVDASGSGSGSVNATAGQIAVYLDNSRFGDITSLREVTASSIATIRFLDAPTAMATLPGAGSNVIAGAIVITTRAGR